MMLTWLRWKGKLSISVTVFLLSSVVIRFLGMGCICLGIYMKYGDNVINDNVLPALNSMEIYRIPLGTYIERLVFSTATVFIVELLCGIVALVAGTNKKESLLIAYVFLSLFGLAMYIVHIVLWGLLSFYVNNFMETDLNIYYRRYTSGLGNLAQNYYDRWTTFYSSLVCCGSHGTNSCSGVTRPGCYNIYATKIHPYIQVYIGVFLCCFLFQATSITAADYTIIKMQLKAQGGNRISNRKGFILCMWNMGILPKFWTFLKKVKERSRQTFISFILKFIILICNTGLIITGIVFISSSFVSHTLIDFYEQIEVFYFNAHNVMAGFAYSILILGCLSVGNAIIGIMASMRNSVMLHTFTFVGLILLAILKMIATIFWIILFHRIYNNIGDQLDGLASKVSYGSSSNAMIYRLMMHFKCCELKNTIISRFCYSDNHESVTVFSYDYFRSGTNNLLNIYGSPSHKVCKTTIQDNLAMISGFCFTFLAIGILCDIVGPILISREFKDTQKQILNQDTADKNNEGSHLVPWLVHLYRKNKSRNRPLLLYIILTTLMIILNLSFIVLASIFSLSYHVSRDYIKHIGELYDFVAISGVVLISCFLIVRILGFLAVINRWRRVLFVTTPIMVFNVLFCLTYIIMVSILRHKEYPCAYFDTIIHNCSGLLASTSGTAIGMFVIECLAQVLSLIIHDRSYQYFTVSQDTENVQQIGLFKTFYNFIIVKRALIKNRKSLEKPMTAYIIASAIILLLEITFIVLVYYYGFTGLEDRAWISTGLENLNDSTVNIGLLFDFLRIAVLVLIPIVSVNRVLGIFSLLTTRRRILYLNTCISTVTIIFTLICIILTSFLLKMLQYCSDNNQPCPWRKDVIVGVPVAFLSTELIMQVLSCALNDRSYKYFVNDPGDSTELIIERNERKGLLHMIYDKLFRRRPPFKDAPKLEICIAIYTTISVVLTMLEVCCIALISVYGLSYLVDRNWITGGLSSTTLVSMDLEVLYQFLAIGSLVLIPILCINRFVGIVAVSTQWKRMLYLSSILLCLTTVLTIIFVVLSSSLLSAEYRCSYFLHGKEQTCPRMELYVGFGLGMLLVELVMQVMSFVIIDRSFKYFEDKTTGSTDVLTDTAGRSGLFLTLYKKIFRRRSSFKDANTFEVLLIIHNLSAVFILALEICFMALDSIYGLSYIIDRHWVIEGLRDLYEDTMNLEILYQFLAISCLVLVPIISANRFFGIWSISTKRTPFLYANTILMTINILLTIIFVALASILLDSEYRCSYVAENGNTMTCPEMIAIVGAILGMLVTELTFQILSVVVNNRAFLYISSEQQEKEEKDQVAKGLLYTLIDKVILKREILSKYKQLKIPMLVSCVGTVVWMVVQILFWIGTILEIGSPRLISDRLMHVLYTKSGDSINLGYLLNGLGYTATGLIPAVIIVRILGLVAGYKQKLPAMIATAIVSVLLVLGCATLFGLSTYHMQFVYGCYGSSDVDCLGGVTGILLNITSVFLTFFLVETILHILQSCFFLYLVKVLSNDHKPLHILDERNKSTRSLKIAHISIRLFEMVISFMMFLAITFWLAGIHIETTSFKETLGQNSFYDTDLYTLSKGMEITSIVAISVMLINNIISILAIINGLLKTLIVNSMLVVVCLIINVVLLGLQGEIENRMTDPSISVYISFTVVQIACQITYIVMSVFHMKEWNGSKISDSRIPLFNTGGETSQPTNRESDTNLGSETILTDVE